MKVSDMLTSQLDYSPFTLECVKVGEAMEALGYRLIDSRFANNQQTFVFQNEDMIVAVVLNCT